MVTHTDRFCRKFLENNGDNIVKEWGAWSRAPPRRIAGQLKSKWLHDGGDDDWESRNGRANNSVILGRVSENQGQNSRGKDKEVVTNPIFQNLNSENLGATELIVNGSGAEELNGLSVLVKKRRRDNSMVHNVNFIENNSHVKVYDNLELFNTEASLSAMDCDASPQIDLATLSRQASHQP